MHLYARHFPLNLGLWVLSMIACLLASCAAPGSIAPVTGTQTIWPLEGGNAGRTRFVESPISPPLQLQREIPLPESGEFVSPISFADGLVYADGEASLHVYPANSDKAAWEIQLPGYFLSPLIHGKKVFVRAESGDEGYIFALDALSGAKLWQFQFPRVGSEHQNVGGHVTSPVVGGDKILVASAKVFYALNPETGLVEWEFSLAEPVSSSAAASEGIAYIADFTHIYAVAIETGEEKWRFTGQDPSIFFAPVIRNGHVYIGSGTELKALDIATGEEAWRAGTGSSPIVPAGATPELALAKSTHALTAFNTQDGTTVWHYSTLNFISLPAMSADHLYAINRLGPESQLVALDLHTGEEVWRSIPMQLARSAPIIAQEKVIVRTESGSIVTFAADAT